MSHHHTHLHAHRLSHTPPAVFERNGLRQEAHRKRLTWRGLFGGDKAERILRGPPAPSIPQWSTVASARWAAMDTLLPRMTRSRTAREGGLAMP